MLCHRYNQKINNIGFNMALCGMLFDKHIGHPVTHNASNFIVGSVDIFYRFY